MDLETMKNRTITDQPAGPKPRRKLALSRDKCPRSVQALFFLHLTETMKIRPITNSPAENPLPVK